MGERKMIKKILVLFILCTTLLDAKTIYVKYRDTPVNIDNGHFKHLALKSSSFVNNMYYDKGNSYLLVQLRSTYYHYCSIPQNVINIWTNAKSLGRFYNNNIKGNYDCRVNPVPRY